MLKPMRILPAGDAAVLVDLGHNIDQAISRQVHAMADAARQALAPFGPIDVIPGYASLLVSYDPRILDFVRVVELIRTAGANATTRSGTSRRYRIPVAYGGEYGPDLDAVARYHGLSSREVVDRHAWRDYPIFCLGFSPGFPFLGGLDPLLHTPRLPSPRARVAAGAVGIAGEQTGVYPTVTPGGWNLIGRTPLTLFDVQRQPPVPYGPGDVIRFEPIHAAEYGPLAAEARMPNGEPVADAEEAT